MNIDLRPFLGIDIVLAAVVVALFVWRQSVARNEDDTVHVLHGELSTQTVIAAKLDKIDKWGKLFTTITVILGVLVGALYVYQFWSSSSQVPGM
jgi:hypothetical protein